MPSSAQLLEGFTLKAQPRHLCSWGYFICWERRGNLPKLKQGMFYKGLVRRGAEPRWLRPPKPRGSHSWKDWGRDGGGENTSSSLLHHADMPVFCPAASPTLFRAGSPLGRTGCAGSCRLEACSPVAPAHILPSMEGHHAGEAQATSQCQPYTRAPAQVHLPRQ